MNPRTNQLKKKQISMNSWTNNCYYKNQIIKNTHTHTHTHTHTQNTTTTTLHYRSRKIKISEDVGIEGKKWRKMKEDGLVRKRDGLGECKRDGSMRKRDGSGEWTRKAKGGVK